MNSVPSIYLEPGDFHFGAAPLRLTTLLGSCITVTLWHPRRHIGGMCHIQMPGRSSHADAAPDGHYAQDAFVLFDRALQHSGTAAREYVVKLFGGGNMFPNSMASTIDVGDRNLAAARHELARRGVAPAVEHVGGAGHRKLIFDLADGEVRLAFANLEPAKDAAIG